MPDEAVAALGAGKRPPVVVTINGASYRSTVAVMGGRSMVSVSAENRAVTGVAAGDEVEVHLALDIAPRTVDVPEDLATALATEPAAKAFFDGLSVSQRKWHVQNIEGAKTPETPGSARRQVNGAAARRSGPLISHPRRHPTATTPGAPRPAFEPQRRDGGNRRAAGSKSA